MKCKYCDHYLGESFLPVRCPNCGKVFDTHLHRSEQKQVAHTQALLQEARLSRRRRKRSSRFNLRNLRSNTSSLESGTSRRLRRAFLLFMGLVLVGLFSVAVTFLGFKLGFWGEQPLPNVVGWRLERAQEELSRVGCTTQITKVKDDGQPNIVLKMDPAAGSRNYGKVIHLSVSEARIMPEVVGKTKAEAESLLKAQGINYEYTDTYVDKDFDRITSSTSKPGTQLTSLVKVNLGLSVQRRVPDLIGKTKDVAQAELKKLGYDFKEADVLAHSDAEVGKIVSVEPIPGSALSGGSTVTVSIAQKEVFDIKKQSEAVVNAVYNTGSVSGAAPGAHLQPLLDPKLKVGSKTAHDASAQEIWDTIIKAGKKLPAGVPAELAHLPRSIVAINAIEKTSPTTSKVVLQVRWDWSPLGKSYAGQTSVDTHTVELSFNKTGQLEAFSDPQTDIPAYDVH